MKRISLLAAACSLALGLGLAAGPLAARAADGDSKTPLEPALPGAKFDLKAAAVRDPFFPLSTRTAAPLTVVTNVAPSQITAKNFKENGRSGSDDGTLVIINWHSFAPGEKAFIQPLDTAGPKVGVTVLQIKEHSTVIQVDGIGSPLEIFQPEKDR
jgi:hypothetical protein